MSRSAKAMKPSELTGPGQQEALRAAGITGVYPENVDRDMKPQNVLARARPAAARADGYRSRTEARYAEWLHGLSGIVWRYERHPIRLPGKGTRYLADFSLRVRENPNADVGSVTVNVTGLDGRAPALPCFARPCLVDVKGTTSDGRPYWRGESRRRALDGAAEWWDSLGVPLFVAWKPKGSGWTHERVEVRS